MRPLALDAAMRDLARRLIWFESPERALADPVRFVAYAFRHATHDDMKIIRARMTDDDLRDALDHAPPGIIDARSWAYWNAMLGRYPAPPQQGRRLPATDTDRAQGASP